MFLSNFLGIVYVGLYFVISGVFVFLINTYTKIPTYVKRKLLHFVGVLSIFPFIYFIPNWQVSIITSLVLAVLAIPVTSLIDKKQFFVDFLQEKHIGEVKFTICSVLIMITIVNAIFIGWLNKPYYAVLVVIVWGFGDAFASIIGQSIGKHYFKISQIEAMKTYEGYIANLSISTLITFLILFFYAKHPWYYSLLGSIIIGLSASTTELFSKKGRDTYFVPLVILLLCLLFSFTMN